MPVAEQRKLDLTQQLASQNRYGALGGDFLRIFYGNVAYDDMTSLSPTALLGAAMSALEFSQQRQLGEYKLRCFVPQEHEHGFTCPYSLLEIINDDMPFLVDSVTAELNRHDLMVHLVIHPVIWVERDANGQLISLSQQKSDRCSQAESLMQLQLDPMADTAAIEKLLTDLRRVLEDVRLAVRDWRAMRQRALDVADELSHGNAPQDADILEAQTFLRWIEDQHFTFLGCRRFHLEGRGEGARLVADPESGLGLLENIDMAALAEGPDAVRERLAIRELQQSPDAILVTKGSRRSTVHRRVFHDIVRVKRYGAEGQLVGEDVFLGLFTSAAYSRSAREIPHLRRKAERVLAEAGFAPASHDGKALAHILDTYPRDELFQIGHEDLKRISLGILHLQERQRTALFLRPDAYGRFISALVYVPRDRFDVSLRRRIQEILQQEMHGQVKAFYMTLDDGPLARLYMIVTPNAGDFAKYDQQLIEDYLIEATRSWGDRLAEALRRKDNMESHLLRQRYSEAFPTAYRDSTSAIRALDDIAAIEEILAGANIAVRLNEGSTAGQLHFKIFYAEQPLSLSRIMPLLEHLGLAVIAEHPYEIKPAGSKSIWLHDFIAELPEQAASDLDALATRMQAAFLALWQGNAESDSFCRLVLRAGLEWRDVVILQGLARYLRQARFAYSPDFIADCLGAHPAIARALVQLFHARFDPKIDARDAAISQHYQQIDSLLQQVKSLDEDKSFRRLRNLIMAALRTNFYQQTKDGNPKPALAIKFDSRQIDELPLPRPVYEIFVYSPRMEAIHLRGGKVARGGIRWSDRREDYRTEILGLLKAQMVKNTVIVPVGAKGGFILKQLPSDASRDKIAAEGIACYEIMVQSLLDITDNMVNNQIIPPEDTVRHDGDDHYLVVAADKGTATFSDIANRISMARGFWLDDAFASGGGAGYDHKKMGITARGAWESVKRHFRELDHDTQSQPFTVIGVGDMAGDVFGNGMLQSSQIKLLAAFNHLHIFVDPNPDPAISFAERQRLFQLPRSQWSDYDPACLSAGGQVFERSAKELRLTAEIKERFAITADSLTPAELVRHLLQAEIDLLWFGGIGTFIKGSHEGHHDVADKSNDALRINGRDIRARVVAEGANLAMTQLGRIEYASRGGRLNTDFIDNSAGVDTSDHEVNIKILLQDVMQQKLLDRGARDKLLEDMTDNVAALVLRDNYQQTQCLSMMLAQGSDGLDAQLRLIGELEAAGKLNRAVENLPDDEALRQRAQNGQGFTRPELAVILSYAKMALFDEILATDLPDEKIFAPLLLHYFPTPLQQRYASQIASHRLRREIIATMLVNELVNRTGPAFTQSLMDKSGARSADVARAFYVVQQSLGLDKIWAEIEALDLKIPASGQTALNIEIVKVLDRTIGWYLVNRPQPLDIASEIAMSARHIQDMRGVLEASLSPSLRKVMEERRQRLIRAGAPPHMADDIARLRTLAAANDIGMIADQQRAKDSGGWPLLAQIYYTIGERFGLRWMREQLSNLPAQDYWQKQSTAALLDELYLYQRLITARISSSEQGSGDEMLEAWIKRQSEAVARFDRLYRDMQNMAQLHHDVLAVAARWLRSLTL